MGVLRFRMLVVCLSIGVVGSLACAHRMVIKPALGMGLSLHPPLDRTAADDPLPTAKPRLVASLRRTACFGACPVFSVEIWSDGQVRWQGERHVERVGAYSARVSAAWIAELLKAGDRAGYFGLASQYPRNGQLVPDVPLTITMLRRGNREHQVTNNADAPLALLRFERYWLEKLETLRWKPVEQ